VKGRYIAPAISAFPPSMAVKQWRKPRTRIRRLIKLGVSVGDDLLQFAVFFHQPVIIRVALVYICQWFVLIWDDQGNRTVIIFPSASLISASVGGSALAG
jgi:hypothetical protein